MGCPPEVDAGPPEPLDPARKEALTAWLEGKQHLEDWLATRPRKRLPRAERLARLRRRRVVSTPPERMLLSRRCSFRVDPISFDPILWDAAPPQSDGASSPATPCWESWGAASDGDVGNDDGDDDDAEAFFMKEWTGTDDEAPARERNLSDAAKHFASISFAPETLNLFQEKGKLGVLRRQKRLENSEYRRRMNEAGRAFDRRYGMAVQGLKERLQTFGRIGPPRRDIQAQRRHLLRRSSSERQRGGVFSRSGAASSSGDPSSTPA